MSTVNPATETPPLTPICPTCGLPAQQPRYRVESYIATGEYIDALGHVWRVMWLVNLESTRPALERTL